MIPDDFQQTATITVVSQFLAALGFRCFSE
jgi:hypothetical protein